MSSARAMRSHTRRTGLLVSSAAWLELFAPYVPGLVLALLIAWMMT